MIKVSFFNHGVFFIAIGLLTSCENSITNEKNIHDREWKTSFEKISEFDGFYITPQAHLNTSFHGQDSINVRSGSFSHKAWIIGANEKSTSTVNNNHRGYPTIQLYKTNKGSFSTPCVVRFWVWLDMELNANQDENDWFSFATFTDDPSDNWERTVLINLSYQGNVHLAHVPKQGQQIYRYQPNKISFPQREWVELVAYLDFRKEAYAKVWQNGILVSEAKLEGVSNQLSQIHFGMYSSPQITQGVIYNDDIIIKEISSENDIAW